MNNTFNPFSKNISIIKNYFKRKNTLVIGISAALEAAVYIFLAFAFVSMYTKIVDFVNVAIVSLLSVVPLFSKLFSALGISGLQLSPGFISANIVPIVSSALPFVLFYGFFAFAFIYIFAKCRSSKAEATPKLGLDFAFIISVIQFAFYIIGIIGVIALFFSFSFIITIVSNTSGIVLGIVLAILSAFFIALGFYRMKFYKTAKQSMECIEIKSEGAKVYAVLETVNTVFCGIVAFVFIAEFVASLFFSAPLLSLLGFDLTEVMLILFCLAFITTLHFVRQIGLTKLAFSYNKYINDVRFGFSVDYEELKSVSDENFPVVSEKPVSGKVEFVVPKEKKKKKATDKKVVSDEIKIKAKTESKEEKHEEITKTEPIEQAPEKKDIAQEEKVIPVEENIPKPAEVPVESQPPVIEPAPKQNILSVEIDSSVDESEDELPKPENEVPFESKTAEKEEQPTVEKDVPVCPSCNSKIKNTDLFCKNCGHKLK